MTSMPFLRTSSAALIASLGLLAGTARADDLDALTLEAAPTPAVTTASRAGDPKPLRMYAEAALGRVDQRYGLATANSRRLSLDLVASSSLGGGWRAVLSDRLDHFRPVDAGSPDTLNSLREAYVSWQQEGGGLIAEVGRINLRNGPAYGFNPTDYFRDGALRAVTTADPFALRENRLGVVMLRAQRLWASDTVSLALAPKLADAPSSQGLSLDLGATNAHNKALASWSHRFSDRVNTQLLWFSEAGRGSQLGASATALLSDSLVGHVEWSRGRNPGLLAASDTPNASQQWAAGLTFTAPSGLALTAEYAYNGGAPDRAAWDKLAASGGAPALLDYLNTNQTHQDNASRGAWLLYVSQKSVGTKNLDLAGLVRINADDHSRLTWLELRYHFGQADAAVQWQTSQGSALSEYGVLPYRQSLQLLGTWYF